jgi:hypothetical protein
LGYNFTVEAQIKESLIALFDGISRSDGALINQQTARLDEIWQTQGRTLHPQLLHFLSGRSYAKALDFLNRPVP